MRGTSLWRAYAMSYFRLCSSRMQPSMPWLVTIITIIILYMKKNVWRTYVSNTTGQCHEHTLSEFFLASIHPSEHWIKGGGAANTAGGLITDAKRPVSFWECLVAVVLSLLYVYHWWLPEPPSGAEESASCILALWWYLERQMFSEVVLGVKRLRTTAL